MHPVSNPGKGLEVEINVHSQLDLLATQQTGLLGMWHGKLGAGYDSAMTWFIAPRSCCEDQTNDYEKIQVLVLQQDNTSLLAPPQLSN